jgi:hypothetical protein
MFFPDVTPTTHPASTRLLKSTASVTKVPSAVCVPSTGAGTASSIVRATSLSGPAFSMGVSTTALAPENGSVRTSLRGVRTAPGRQ